MAYLQLFINYYRFGGQVRQFILDDKGSVCIGSFGLKKSAGKNAAESALNASLTIISSLLSQSEIDASIGITTGKVYCGLVGSPDRYEYSIMGPSVNLSARLMSLADIATVYCDEATKKKDKIHSFSDGMQIIAKGYNHKINTYSPKGNLTIIEKDANAAKLPSTGMIRPQSGRIYSVKNIQSIIDHYVEVTQLIKAFLNTSGDKSGTKEELITIALYTS